MSHDAVWMTPTAHARLTDELATLTAGSAHDDVARKTRVTELRDLLARAVVKEMPDDGLVEPGMLVTVTFEDNDETLSFVLGDRLLLSIDPSIDHPVYSPTSPLGSAVNGLYPGDRAEVVAPRGNRVLTIVRVRPVA